MPRRPRVHVPDGVYHSILRGNHRQRIFITAADYHRFEHILAEAVTRFERRYRANLVDRDDYLRELVRYIHMNPVRAAIVRTPHEFRWSSHSAYLGAPAPTWLTTGFVMELFGEPAEVAKANYGRFMASEVDDAALDRLRPGWPHDAKFAAPSHSTLRHAAGAGHRVHRSFDEIIASALARHTISLEDLTGPGKQRPLSNARAEIVDQSLASGAATLTEVASKLNRSKAALSALKRRRLASAAAVTAENVEC
jgi:REP element-mobilizing transposase RayT